MLFCGVGFSYLRVDAFSFTQDSQMSVVVVPKFNFVQFLRSIVRHRITHLLCVCLGAFIFLYTDVRRQPRTSTDCPPLQGRTIDKQYALSLY
jgi:hypothetical protein